MATNYRLDEVTHKRVIEIHESLGEERARRFFGLSRETYARAIGRMTQQRATVELIRSKVAAVEAQCSR